MKNAAIILATFLAVVVSACATLAGPVTYYVSPSGEDTNAGTSVKQAWETIDRVNQGDYRAGESILFEGGQTFDGSLFLYPDNSHGTPDAPITVGSYAEGRATIASGTENGLFAYNTGALHVTNLTFSGDATRCGGGGFEGAHGVYVYKGRGKQLSHIHVDNIEVTGYCIGIAGFAEPTGKLEDVHIERISAHDNLAGGIVLIAPEPPGSSEHAFADVYVGYSHTHHSPGVPQDTEGANISGSGILVYKAEDALIEHNTAHDNGGRNTCVDGGDTGGGPFAIWAYGSGITMQHNEAFRQRVAAECPWDGGAFNLNGPDMLMQYNYAHDNDGLPFLVDNSPGNRTAVVRYNLSENDGQLSKNQGMILMYGGDGDYQVYNNTIYASRSAGSRGPMVVMVSLAEQGNRPTGIYFRNNLFVSDNKGPMLLVVDPQNYTDLRFENNAYFDPSGRYEIRWGSKSYEGVRAWSDVTGQETTEGTYVGRTLDPLLCDPGGGTMYPDPPTAYRLRPTSPLIDAGWNLAERGLDTGNRDFFGNPLPAGADYDIGAHEHQPGQACP